MSIRDILVHLKAHEDWSPHIDHAIGTAKLFSSHLRALVTFHEVVMLRNLPRISAQTLEDQMEKDAAIALHLKTRFLKACADAGVVGSFDMAEGAAGDSYHGRRASTTSPSSSNASLISMNWGSMPQKRPR